VVVNIELGLLASVAGSCEFEEWIIGLLQNVGLYSPKEKASHSRK